MKLIHNRTEVAKARLAIVSQMRKEHSASFIAETLGLTPRYVFELYRQLNKLEGEAHEQVPTQERNYDGDSKGCGVVRRTNTITA